MKEQRTPTRGYSPGQRARPLGLLHEYLLDGVEVARLGGRHQVVVLAHGDDRRIGEGGGVKGSLRNERHRPNYLQNARDRRPLSGGLPIGRWTAYIGVNDDLVSGPRRQYRGTTAGGHSLT